MSNDKTTEQPIPQDTKEFSAIKSALRQIFWDFIALSEDGKAIEGNPAVHRMAQWVYEKYHTTSSPNPSRAGEPKRIIPEGSYFVAQCEKCGFKGASSEWNGGGQIADTGDYGDSYCPVCGHVDVPEADDDIYIDQRELFMTKIWQLGNRISQLEWELYESKTERAGESDSEMRNNAIAFTIWAAEKGWLLHPDQDEDEEYGFYKPSDDFDIPDERLFGGQLYDLYLQHLNDSK